MKKLLFAASLVVFSLQTMDGQEIYREDFESYDNAKLYSSQWKKIELGPVWRKKTWGIATPGYGLEEVGMVSKHILYSESSSDDEDSGDLRADRLIISPEITIPETNKDIVLKFNIAKSKLSDIEKCKFYVVEAKENLTKDVIDKLTPLETIEINAKNQAKLFNKEYKINNFKAKKVKLVFRHFDSPADGLRLYIDDISINQIDAPSLSISETADSNTIKLMQNPVNDKLIFSKKLSDVYTIFNSNGNIALNGNIQNEDNIDINALPTGVYFISIAKQSFKFIKK